MTQQSRPVLCAGDGMALGEGNRAASEADRVECALLIMTMQNIGGMSVCYKCICSAVGLY